MTPCKSPSSTEIVSSLELSPPIYERIKKILTKNPLQFTEERAERLVQSMKKHITAPTSDHYRVKKNPDCDVTFSLKRETTEIVFHIHRPKSQIGYGGFKRIKFAVEMALPSLEGLIYVRHRPLKKDTPWNPLVIKGASTHKMLFNALQHLGDDLRITLPPDENPLNPEKEFIQAFYPYTLCNTPQNFSPTEMLSEFCALFNTLHAIHGHGFIHRDIKPTNILLDFESRMFINDFDHTGHNFHGTVTEYEYWDKATQAGLHNPYADVVGGIVTMLHALFPKTYYNLNFREETTHKSCKVDDAATIAAKLLEVDEGPHKELYTRVIELACKVFQAEDRVFSAITSSIIYSFMKNALPEEAPKDCFCLKAAKKGLRLYIIKRFSDPSLTISSHLTNNGHPLSLENIKIVINFLSAKQRDKKIEELCPLEILLENYYNTLSKPEQTKLLDIIYDHDVLEMLLYDDHTTAQLDLKSATEDLFLQLSSEEAQEREKGYNAIFKIGSSAQEIQAAIGEILGLHLPPNETK